jgi:hypothetical protein
MSLDGLTRGDFEAHRGSEFAIEAGHAGGGVVVRLVEVDGHGHRHERGGREAFSLLFRGPAGAGLAQGMYLFRHPELGPIDIFVVPLGPDAEGHRYEAVFT